MKKHLILFMVLGLLVAGPAYADLFGFYSITNTIAGDAAIGEAQLQVKVTSDDTGKGGDVLFKFSNAGPDASSITDIYFDGIIGILNPLPDPFTPNPIGSVDFGVGANPGHLPGYDPAFFTDFTADSDVPTQPNGVNPGENLGISFDLIDSIGLDGVLAAMYAGDIRIGLHVQGFASGGSESFINNPVPEPATMLLLGSGLIGFAVVGRKKFFKK
jgi:hypothetical protein